ncbi:MAG: GspE/PulE family protein [Patescibacteria group bacterium]|jgi:type IV pilus assembly protein PilB
MTQDIPSIEDLMQKTAPSPAGAAPKAGRSTGSVSITKTEEQLQKTIQKVELQGKEAEAKAQAATIGVEYVNLKGFPISPDALTIIPEAQAKELKAISFIFTGAELRIAAVQPASQQIKDLLFQLSERNKTHGALYKITEESFEEAYQLYANLPKIKAVVKGVQIKEEELNSYQEKMEKISDIANVLSGATMTDVLAIVIAAALKLRSSDIHIEAEEQGIMVRFRVDGILQEAAILENSQWKKIISRIKLIAGLKLNITDRPQDGRFTIFQKNNKIDVRTSTLPTAWGESVVLRILNTEAVKLDFADLGFRPAALKRLEAEILKPHGMIVTTGPTGSGKTTTLYAILKRLNEPGVKIITLEDPIEYKIQGINQSQIDTSRDYTFAKGLKSILRQDPDIIMVGEIRDLDTAETAIQAALTGHLMLSTIHTNDAAGAVPRFISMGVKPFLLAPAVNAIMGQRLARRLCDKCRAPSTLGAETLQKVQEIIAGISETSGETKPTITATTFFAAKGCEACNGTGYKGRIGLYEILVKNQEVEAFILSENISEYAMRDIAKKQGMITMLEDGILKASEGLTTIDEVFRIAGM